VRVVAFSGRESDAPLGIWGSIANQLGKKEQFADYYSPLSAPGQTAWVNLLKGEPLVIMLDELPPYFENAKSKRSATHDLSVVTATAHPTCWLPSARTSCPTSAWSSPISRPPGSGGQPADHPGPQRPGQTRPAVRR
jgi:hypothetical protein